MTTDHVTVDQWTDMFRAIGLKDAEMLQWHAEFERRHPQGHQGFLEWLRLPEDRIADIRRRSEEAAS
ncbi:MAG: hypothetical protein AAF560_22580 [Acidobacteriota bacterium]